MISPSHRPLPDNTRQAQETVIAAAGFEPAFPASQRSQSYALDRASLGFGPRRGWEDNSKMNLREVGWRGMNWIDLAQDTDRWKALVNAGVNL